jgi:hypothetical protein
LCRGLIPFWAQDHQNVPLAQTGTAFALGGGSESARRAKHLAELGYRTALFADSDAALDPDVPALEAAGVTVIQWTGAVSTEERVALDLPSAAVQAFFDLIVELKGADSALDAVRKALPGTPVLTETDIETWGGGAIDEPAIRQALARAATKTNTFKQIEAGEQLAALVGKILPENPGTDLSVKLSAIAAWCYDP